MTVFYVGAACLVAGFIAGALVYRNNAAQANAALAPPDDLPRASLFQPATLTEGACGAEPTRHRRPALVPHEVLQTRGAIRLPRLAA